MDTSVVKQRTTKLCTVVEKYCMGQIILDRRRHNQEFRSSHNLGLRKTLKTVLK